MERKTLLYQPSGQADKRSYSQVNAPAGAFGDAGGAMAGLGRDIQSLGGSVNQIGQNRKNIKDELQRRDLADKQSGLDAATRKALQLTQEERAAQENDPSFTQPDDQVKHMSEIYQRNLLATAKEFKVDPKLVESPEYAQFKEREYSARDDGLARQDIQVAGLRFDKLNTIKNGVVSEMSLPDNTPNGSIDDNLTRLEGVAGAITHYPGLSDTRKNILLSDLRNKASLVIGQYANSLTDEERLSAQSRLVGVGFTDNDARAITKAATLTDESKRVLKEKAKNFASAGNAVKAWDLIHSAGLPANEVAQLTDQNNIIADNFGSKKALFASTSLTVPERNALREELRNDASGVAVIQRSFKGRESAFSTEEWKAMQSDFSGALDVTIAQLDKNPGQFIDNQYNMQEVTAEVTYALQQITSRDMSPEDKAASRKEVSAALKKYSVAYDIEAKKLEITHTPGLPRIPQAAASGLADALTGNPKTAESTARYLRDLVLSEDEGGRDLAQGVVSNLSRRGDEKSKRVASGVSLIISAGSAGSVEVESFIATVSAHAFDFDKQQRVESGLSKSQIFVGGTEKTVGAGAYVDNLMATVGTTSSVDTVDTVFTQRISSADKGQNLNNLAAAFSGTNDTDIKASQDMLRGTVLNMAADAQGNVTKESLDRAVTSLTSMATTAGLVSVKNPVTNLYNLAQVSVKKSKTISILSPAQVGQFESITNVSASAQAVANYFPSFSKTQSAARYNTGTSGLTSAVLDLSKATTHPMDMVASFYEKGVNAYSRWNMTLLGRDVGTTDISEDYLFPKAMAKFGFVTEGFKDPGKKDGAILSPLEFSNRVYQVPQPDGSIDVMWKEGGATTLSGRMSKGTDRTFGKVYTVPAKQVRAAYDYARLQGTSAAADATYDAVNSGKYASKPNDPYGQLVADTAVAVWANSKWKAIGKVMDKHMPIQPISPRMMEVSPVAQFSSALKGPIDSTEDLMKSSLSIEEPGLLVLADRILAAQDSVK
jgi:hypothetical protein